MTFSEYDDYEQLRFQRRDNGVLLITMDRPEKYNATDEQLHGELARVWADVSADPGTRVAVVTGAGKAFSAGGDLAMVKRMAGDHDRVAHMLSEMSDMVYNMINCEKPIVSAINGVADAVLPRAGRHRGSRGLGGEARAALPFRLWRAELR